MVFLFWLLWAFDLLTALFLLWAIGFRQGFGGSTGLQVGWLLLVILSLIGGPIVRFGLRWQLLSLGIVALPGILLLGWYLLDKLGKNSMVP